MSQGLTARELAQIRADCAELLPDTCTILTVTRTSDGAGGWVDATSTAVGGTAVPCRLDFSDHGVEGLANSELTPYKAGILSMAYDKVITPLHRVLINSVAYNVIGVNLDQSWIGIKRVSVERIP